MSLQKGLVGHWTFDAEATSNGTTYDSSAYDDHVSVPSSVVTGTSSPIGQGFSFDETNSDRMTAPDNSGAINDAFLSNNYTVSFWVRPFSEDGSTDWPDIFDTGGDNWRIEYPRDGVAGVRMYDSNASDSNLQMADVNNNVNVSSWNHLLFTVTSDGTSSTTRAYLNGVEETVRDTGDLDEDAGSDFRINDVTTVTHDLSDIRVYDRTLSKSEARALYNMRSQRQKTNDLAKGLVGYWTMDDADTSGGTLFDKSARDAHGSLSSNVTTSVSGEIGEAYSFNGTDTNVSTEDYDIIEPLSLGSWVKFDEFTSQSCFVSHGRASFIWMDTNNIRYELNDGSTYFGDAREDVANLSTGVWYHYIGTYDGSEVKLYRDGNLVDTVSATNSLVVENLNFSIGSWLDGGSRFHSGDIDEALLYNRALSANEINRIYNQR